MDLQGDCWAARSLLWPLDQGGSLKRRLIADRHPVNLQQLVTLGNASLTCWGVVYEAKHIQSRLNSQQLRISNKDVMGRRRTEQSLGNCLYMRSIGALKYPHFKLVELQWKG